LETGVKALRNQPTGRPLALAGGLAAIIAYLVSTTAAWLLYPGSFTPFKNWLSDLGNPVRNPSGAIWYNTGCVLTALGLLLFILGLSRWRSARSTQNALIWTSQVTGLASVVSLALIGVYSENHLRRHMLYSNWFFASFPLFIGLFSTGLINHRNGSKRIGLAGLGVVVVGLWFHLVFPGSRPLEWVTELAFLIYVGMVAWNTGAERPVEP
jgi:hypothetical membrane protein